jgi:predicted alpha/beta-fold hydrolase
MVGAPTAMGDPSIETGLAATPFRPAAWLPGGLAHTLWAARSRGRVPMALERWTTPDGDFLRLHFATGRDPSRPLVLLLHGLEGSVASGYVTGVARATARIGFGLAVLEFRSCGGELNQRPETYHSGATADLGFVVGELVRRAPGRPIHLIGFSLGGNVALKWLGEQGEALPAELRAAAAVSPPFDLAASSRRSDRWLGGVIARHFMRSLVPKALAKARQFPGLLDAERIRRCRSFAAFDEAVTAPLHGFRSAAHYWAAASCGPYLDAIRRPTVVFAARDDPLNPASTIPGAIASPFVVPQFTDRGGHVGFVEGAAPWRARSWAEEQAVRFFALQDRARSS